MAEYTEIAAAYNVPLPSKFQFPSLAKLPNDIVKWIYSYVSPPASCEIKSVTEEGDLYHQYTLQRGAKITHKFIVPHWFPILEIEEIAEVYKEINSFLDPTKDDAIIHLYFCREDGSSYESVIMRKGDLILLELNIVESINIYTLCLEADSYYQAVCTIVRDLQELLPRLQKLAAEIAQEKEEN